VAAARAGGSLDVILAANIAVSVLPLTRPAACPGFLVRGLGWMAVGLSGCGDRIWAGQAAAVGGPQAVVNRVIHSCSCASPRAGRCSVMCPRPCRAVRATTSIRSWRMVAPVGPVGEDLLHDGVVAVLFLGLDQLERGIGEDGVVAPDGEQLILPGSGLLIQVADPADDQPGGDGLALL